MMSDRKAELERKKAKLQAIREEKERRRREKEQKDVRDKKKFINEILSLYICKDILATIVINKMICLWVIGRRSYCSCRWYGQGSAQGDRCDVIFFGCRTSIRYITIYMFDYELYLFLCNV